MTALMYIWLVVCFQEKNLVVRETPAANARTVFAQYDPEGVIHSLRVCVGVSACVWAWIHVCVRAHV